MKPCNDKGCLDYIHHKFFCNCQCELGRKMTESQFYAKQGKARQAVTKKGGAHKMKNYQEKQDAYYASLGLEFIGRQERLDKFPLDMFNDLLTGSTHLRRPEESVYDMVKRIRGVSWGGL